MHSSVAAGESVLRIEITATGAANFPSKRDSRDTGWEMRCVCVCVCVREREREIY